MHVNAYDLQNGDRKANECSDSGSLVNKFKSVLAKGVLHRLCMILCFKRWHKCNPITGLNYFKQYSAILNKEKMW